MRFTLDNCLSFLYLTAHMPTCTAAYPPGMNGVAINQTQSDTPGPALAIHAVTRTTRDIMKGQFPEDLSGHDSETTRGIRDNQSSFVFIQIQQAEAEHTTGRAPRTLAGRRQTRGGKVQLDWQAMRSRTGGAENQQRSEQEEKKK